MHLGRMTSTGKVPLPAFPGSPPHAVRAGPQISCCYSSFDETWPQFPVTVTAQRMQPTVELPTSYAHASPIMYGTAPSVTHSLWGTSASTPVMHPVQGVGMASHQSWGTATTANSYIAQTPLTPKCTVSSYTPAMTPKSPYRVTRGASVERGYGASTRFPAAASPSRSNRSPLGAASGDRVLDERPITREELAATGNLVEEAPTFVPSPGEQRFASSPVSVSQPSQHVRQAEVVPVSPAGYIASSVSIEPAPASPIIPAHEHSPKRRQASSHVPAVTVQAPATTYAYAPASPARVSRTVVSYKAPGTVTPPTPLPINRGTITTGEPIARSLFDQIDRNHDGVITRAEFREAMRMHRAGRSVSPVAIF